MVRLSPLWACLVLSVLAFSGCIDDGPAPVESGPDVGVVTDPGDFSYLENQTAPGSHVHDYWNGQKVRPVVAERDGCSGGCTVSYTGQDGAVLGHFRPPTDAIVPQGTAWLHINATWEITSGEYSDIALYVKTAQEAESRFVTRLQHGVPVTINSTNEDNDPPHHRLSLWAFIVRALPKDGAESTTLQDFEVYLKVDAERGLPIPVYPPHPDLWNGTDELLLHEQTRIVDYQIETPTYWACQGCLGRHDPDDGMIVPYDADRVEVTLEVTQGLPATIGLRYHGADTWEHSTPRPVTDEPLKRVWHLDVEGRPDSPYAKQSLWSFELFNDQPLDEPKAWTGTYEITIKAIK